MCPVEKRFRWIPQTQNLRNRSQPDTLAPPPPPRGGTPIYNWRDARRNFQKQPLKVTILGVAPDNFIP